MILILKMLILQHLYISATKGLNTKTATVSHSFIFRVCNLKTGARHQGRLAIPGTTQRPEVS